MERPSFNKRRRQFFGSTIKTMKQLNDGDTIYGDTLYKFVTNVDPLSSKLPIKTP